MRCRIAIFALIFGALLVQTSALADLMAYLSGFSGLTLLRNHTVELSLIILIYLGFQRTFWTGILWACAATILVQTFGIAWKGSIHSSYFLVIVLAGLLKRTVVARSYAQKFAIVALFSVASALGQLFFGSAFERFSHPFSGMWGFVLIQAFINASVAPAIFRVLFWIERSANRRLRREENVFYQTEARRGFASF